MLNYWKMGDFDHKSTSLVDQPAGAALLISKKIFDEIMPGFSNVEVEEIDMMSPEGQKLAQKYSVMSSPGIVIDGELFSTGGVNKEKLIEKLKSLK